MEGIQRNIWGRPKLKAKSKSDNILKTLMAVFFVVTLYTVFLQTEYKWDYVNTEIIGEMVLKFFRFDLVPKDDKIEMMVGLINTLGLTFLTTIIGFIIGVILAIFAAENISNKHVSQTIKSIASFCRAVPTIIWVLIFVSGYGLTVTTAVAGMLVHTICFYIKSCSEAFEEVDEGTINALRATGANWWQVVFGSVLPSAKTKLISWYAIRNELNFMVAVIIGPAAGVPGMIGSLINKAARIGEYPTQGFGVMLIFITAFIMEISLNRFRRDEKGKKVTKKRKKLRKKLKKYQS